MWGHIQEAEERLRRHMSEQGGGMGVETMVQARALREMYAVLTLEHFEAAVQNNADVSLWKNVVYKIIESLRSESRHATDAKKGRVVRALLKFLDESSAFYRRLLLRLTEAFNLSVVGIVPWEALSSESMRESERVSGEDRGRVLHHAYRTCHQCIVFLGDLARYSEMHSDLIKQKTYGNARNFYRHALRLLPDCGNPHNQLAVLATYAKDYSAACYHYIRGVQAPEPFPTALDNLARLFTSVDDLIYKHEMSGDSDCEDRQGSDPSEGWAMLYLTQVHGVLFTAKDSDVLASVKENWRATVSEVTEFLTHHSATPKSLTQHVTHVAIMAVFSLYHRTTQENKDEQVAQDAREFAVRVFFDTWDILLTLAVGAPSLESRACITAGIKHLCDFARLHTASWVASSPLIDCDSRIWASLAKFLNSVHHDAANTSTCSATWRQQLVLPEDDETRGFVPLRGAVVSSFGPRSKQKIQGAEAVAYREQAIVCFGLWLAEKVAVGSPPRAPLAVTRSTNTVFPLRFAPNTGAAAATADVVMGDASGPQHVPTVPVAWSQPPQHAAVGPPAAAPTAAAVAVSGPPPLMEEEEEEDAEEVIVFKPKGQPSAPFTSSVSPSRVIHALSVADGLRRAAAADDSNAPTAMDWISGQRKL